MDPATSAAAAAQKPPAQGQTRRCRQEGWRGQASRAINLALILAVTVAFADAAYRARRRPRDLAPLLCCVAKLLELRVGSSRYAQRDIWGAGTVAGEAQRWRVVLALAVWAVVATFAPSVAEAMPLLALKLSVWAVTAVFLGLGFYLLFCCRDAEPCGADPGRRPAKALHELCPGKLCSCSK